MQLIKNIKINYAKKIIRKAKKGKEKSQKTSDDKHWWNFSKLTN